MSAKNLRVGRKEASRLFPAIDFTASGTQEDHLLYGADDYQRLSKLHRALTERTPKQNLASLLQLLEKHPTNAGLLQTIPL